MPQQTRTIHDSRTAEYTIYTFQRSGTGDTGPERWHRQETLNALPDAIKTAKALYESGQYCKVEIKQKYIDPRRNQLADTTFRTFQKKKKQPFKTGITSILIALFSGIIFTSA